MSELQAALDQFPLKSAQTVTPGIDLTPEFNFHPTEEELVENYLKKRVKNEPTDSDLIEEVDIYKCEPWDLPAKSKLPQNHQEWFFFSPRHKKHPNASEGGKRFSRTTEAGYWKENGRELMYKACKIIGMKKNFTFYRGHGFHTERTDWRFIEYSLTREESENVDVPQNADVLCRLYKKKASR